MQEQAKCKYYLCKEMDRSNIYIGCGVYDSMCIAPSLSTRNINVFGWSFGIKFPITHGDTTETAVQQISSFENASMFFYTNEITRKLAERKYWQLLENNIPSHSSAVIVNCIYEHLLILRQSSLDVFKPAEHSSTIDGRAYQTRIRQSASSPLPVFNTAIGAVLPDETAWKDAYVANPECHMIFELIANPSLVVKVDLSKIHLSYHGPLRRDLIILRKSMLVIK